MFTTRRRALQFGAATLLVASTGRVFASATAQVGAMEITSLSDGHLVLSPEFTFGPVPPEITREVAAMFDLNLEAPLTLPCNLTLCRHEDRLVLFDAGAGPQFMPSAGRIAEALDAAGVDPSEVTHVVFTHAHPDHLWGVLDDFDEPFFPEALHMMGAVEFDHWSDPGTVDALPEARKAFAVGAARRLDAVADRLERFGDGDEILPGIAAVMTPGHTVGHMAFELRDGGEALMVVGDAVVNDHISMAYPSVETGNDEDPARAAETRLRLLQRLADEAMPMVGFHLGETGLGRVERAGDGFRFLPL